MDAKLILKLNREVIDRAKHYAKRRGLSLSRLVEGYFLRLTESEEPFQEERKDVLVELAGVLKGLEIGNPRDEYTEYLLKKYS